MRKILLTIMMVAGLSVSSLSAQAAEISGSIGLSSDYFWRGISQNAGNPAISLDLSVEKNAWYLGTWASPVDFTGIDANYEYDFYGGYDMSLTDDLLIGGGFLQYNYKGSDLDTVTELYVGGSYKDMIEVWYYFDHEETDAAYFDARIKVPYVSIVDFHLNYGRHKEGDSVKGFTISKNVAEDISLSLMVLDSARHGKFIDSAALGIQYNF